MRIHTNTDQLPIQSKNALAPGVRMQRVPTVHASRTHLIAYDVALTGSSGRNAMRNNYKAATWDEWGTYLAYLFADDATLKAGPYLSAEHFHWSTGNRFTHGMPDDAHKQHHWELSGVAVTGAYHVYECKECDAMMRRIAIGHTWEGIA